MRSLLAIQPSHGAMLGAATAATLVACLTAPTATRPVAIVIPATPVAAPAPAPVPVPAAVPAPVAPVPTSPRASELLLAFRAGGATYVRLADLSTDEAAGLEMPRHGRLRHVDDDGVHAAIAVVAPRDVPATYAAWKDRTLEVEQGCHAKVNGFAVVARLTGDPSYAGKDVETWSAATVMQSGSPVLAARLDGCTGQYARDAALTPVVVPEVVQDAGLAEAGRAALIASAAAAETQRQWDEQVSQTGGAPQRWTEQPGVVQAEVLRHPLTGETFVSVHGSVSGSCGDPEANVWGLFRVTSQRTLVPVTLRQLGDLRVLDAILDVDGDGTFELLGKTWLENSELLTTATGEVLEHLDRPFYGCPC